MTLRLQPSQRTFEQLKALAASGSSGFARRAQEEMRQRVAESLRKALGRSQ